MHSAFSCLRVVPLSFITTWADLYSLSVTVLQPPAISKASAVMVPEMALLMIPPASTP
jgi:hypothetical protein